MNEIKAEAFLEWQKMPLVKPINCAGCGELIVTSYYQNYFFIFGEAIETYMRLCEGCYELMDKTEE